MKTFYAYVELDAEQLAEGLDCNQADALIKAVDSAQQDYDFTLGVVKYLLSELKKEHEFGNEDDYEFFKKEIMEILNG